MWQVLKVTRHSSPSCQDSVYFSFYGPMLYGLRWEFDILKRHCLAALLQPFREKKHCNNGIFWSLHALPNLHEFLLKRRAFWGCLNMFWNITHCSALDVHKWVVSVARFSFIWTAAPLLWVVVSIWHQGETFAVGLFSRSVRQQTCVDLIRQELFNNVPVCAAAQDKLACLFLATLVALHFTPVSE